MIIVTIAIIVLSSFLYFKCHHTYTDLSTSLDLHDLPIITITDSLGLKHNMLIDTGSNVSVLNKCVLSKGEEHVIITSAGNLSTIGEEELSFSLNGKEYTHSFKLISVKDKLKRSIPFDGIIGNDFLIKYRFIIDYKHHKLYESN